MSRRCRTAGGWWTRRRVRTSVLDPTWGYREEPHLYVRRPVLPRETDRTGVSRRHVQGDWLMDVVVEVQACTREPPLGPMAQLLHDHFGPVLSLKQALVDRVGGPR